jgi:hypothetical protein
MKLRTKRILKILANGCAILYILCCLAGVLIIAIKPSLADSFFDFCKAKLVRFTASQYHKMPKTIDSIEIFTLSTDLDTKDTNGFYGDFEDPIKTLEHKTITGSTATEIAELWGDYQIDPKYQAMCFEPVYGLQFKRSGKIYFQTSVCWHCGAFTVPVMFVGNVEYGFDSDSPGAQKLLSALEKQLPLPKPDNTTNNVTKTAK